MGRILQVRSCFVVFSYWLLTSRECQGYCPVGWVSNISSSYCYYFARDVNATYANATVDCASRGANVTFVDSEDENRRLYLMGPAIVKDDFWISYKRYPGNMWRWPTGNRGTYLAGWDVSEPDGDGECAKQTPWNLGKWRDWPCTLQLRYSCKKLAECGQPLSLTYARRQMSAANDSVATFPPGTTVTYTCLSGYEFSGGVTVKTAICPVGGGSWTVDRVDLSNLQDCVIKKCSTPPTFTNTTSNRSDSATDLGTVVSYQCVDGYWFDPYSMGTTRYMVCNENKQWEGLAGDCQKSFCIRPITGNARCDNPLSTVGTVATYTCDRGYQFKQNKTKSRTFTCTSTTWDPAPDKCGIITCPNMVVKNAEPRSPAGALMTSDDFVYDATVLFRCRNGFKYEDTTVVKSSYCSDNGTWTVNITEDCYAVKCPDAPPNVTYAATDYLQNVSYHYNDTIYYTCVDDRQFSDGSKTRETTCGKDGRWVPSSVGACISDMITIQPTRYHAPVQAKSAEVYGGVAIIIITVLIVTVIVLDALTITKHIDRMKKNLNCLKKPQAETALLDASM